MKRFIFICFVLLTFLSNSVLAEETESGSPVKEIEKIKSKTSKVSISFFVGESILKINDKDLEVEKPYVENGVTLVPLRVISEAFGAKVEWNAEDKSIILTSGETVIKLWVDKTTALVDNKEIALQVPPTIANGKTMVPLRFVTENFGAEVNFDSQTKAIKVVKDSANDNSIRDFARILKTTTKDKIGDSFYEWSFKPAKQLKMDYRSFNGSLNMFSAKDYNLNLYITYKDKETLETIKETELKRTNKYSLIDQGTKHNYYYIVYKNEDGIYEMRYYIKNNYVYILMVYAKDTKVYNGQAEIKNMLDSFDISFVKSDSIEDLSDANSSGYRLYNNKKFKWSANILADWYEVSNKDKEDEVSFVKNKRNADDVSCGLVFNINSVEDGLTLDKWIEHEKQIEKDEYNPKLINISEPTDIIVNGLKAKKVYGTIKKQGDTIIGCDIYIIDKNYKYHYGYWMSNNKNNELKEKIESSMNSFKFSEPDANEIGKLLDKDMLPKSNATKKIENKKYNWSMDIPISWTKSNSSNDADDVLYFDSEKFKGMLLFVKEVKDVDLYTYTKYYEDKVLDPGIKSGKWEKLGSDTLVKDGVSIQKYSTKTKNESNSNYEDVFIFKNNDYIYTLILSTDELYYNDKSKEIMNSIWKSFSLK